jgi:hypothetical protein
MTDNNDNDNPFSDVSFHMGGKNYSCSEFVALMNEKLSSDDPQEFLPVLGPLSPKQSLVLVEMTACGLLSPSYNSYGFMLINTLCENKEQVFKMYEFGSNLFKEKQEEYEEIINEIDKETNKKFSKPSKNKKNKKNK